LAKIRDPVRFSEHFRLPRGMLIERGALDPLLNVDTPLFIDPLLLQQSAHPEMQAAHRDWVAYFTDIIRLLRVARGPGDVPWREAERRFTSREFKGTCLGYGSGSIIGSGIGRELRDRLVHTAHRIVELGIEDPTLFPLLALLESDVGPDRISDQTTRIISRRLAEFTIQVLDGAEIPTAEFDVNGATYRLPVNPFVADRGRPLPVVLVPTDVLRDLPIATDWEGVESAAAHNEELRARINAAVGDIWVKHSAREKRRNRDIFLASREAFQALLDIAASVPKTPYDVRNDPDGIVQWLELGRAVAEANPIQLALIEETPGEVKRVVAQIIEHYKYTIEHQGLWKNLYDKNKNPLHEHYAQRLFFAMALSFCKTNNLAITPEANSGGGPVDFLFSRGFNLRIVVELKLSTNQRLKHGYTEQLEVYKAAEETDEGFFVVLDVGGIGKQVDAVQKMETAARNARDRHSQVVVVDARPKKSASVR
jgi:hypothetical protein